jgi:hypothetical protein
MTNHEIIADAIINKKQVTAFYNGHLREMCPHVLGTKNGRTQCLFYQFGGGSSSGTITPNSQQNWRCIPVDTLEISEVKTGIWHTGSNHSRPQTCVDFIDVEVEI